MSLESEVSSMKDEIVTLTKIISGLKNTINDLAKPKVLKPYTTKKLSEVMEVHYETVLNWIYEGNILKKEGVESFEKQGKTYIVMIDEDKLKKK